MKKLILTLLIICITAFCFQYLVLADIRADIDEETSRVTINIQLEDAANKKVAVEVFKPGKSEADIASLTPENIADVYSYVREVTADSNGKVTFSFKPGGELGKYSVRVRADGADAIMYSNVFNYITSDFEQNFLSAYTGEDKTSAQRLSLIESNAEIIGLDAESMADMKEDQKLALVDFAGDNFGSLKELKAALECGITAMHIKNGSDASVISAAFDKYSDSLESYCAIYTLYETYFSDAEKKELYEALPDFALLSLEDYSKQLGNKIFLHSVKNSDNHLNIEDILRISEQWLGEDFSDYYSLKSKKDVNLAVINGNYNTPSELCEALHTEVEYAKDGAGSGSGFGSGGSVSSSPSKGSSVNVQVGSGALPGNGNVNQPTLTPGNKNAFEDVPNGFWAEKAIYALVERGIINGISESMYAPSANVTREEFVKLLVCAFFEVDLSAETYFEDVADDNWSYPYTATAVKLGIVNGISETQFGFGMPITRQDMAVMLKRATDRAGIVADSVKDMEFHDESTISDYAYDAVIAMAKSGVINGFENGDFVPAGTATRAQAAKMVYEALAMKGGR